LQPPVKRLFPCFCQNLVPVERKGHTSTGSQLFGTPFRINDDCLLGGPKLVFGVDYNFTSKIEMNYESYNFLNQIFSVLNGLGSLSHFEIL